MLTRGLFFLASFIFLSTPTTVPDVPYAVQSVISDTITTLKRDNLLQIYIASYQETIRFRQNEILSIQADLNAHPEYDEVTKNRLLMRIQNLQVIVARYQMWLANTRAALVDLKSIVDEIINTPIDYVPME